jgi:hypothetical protein
VGVVGGVGGVGGVVVCPPPPHPTAAAITQPVAVAAAIDLIAWRRLSHDIPEDGDGRQILLLLVIERSSITSGYGPERRSRPVHSPATQAFTRHLPVFLKAGWSAGFGPPGIFCASQNLGNPVENVSGTPKGLEPSKFSKKRKRLRTGNFYHPCPFLSSQNRTILPN